MKGKLFIAMMAAAMLMVSGCGQNKNDSNTSETVLKENTVLDTTSSEDTIESADAGADTLSSETADTASETDASADETENLSASFGPKSSVTSTDVTSMDRNVLMTAYRFLNQMDSTVKSEVADMTFIENLMGIPGELNRISDNGDEYYRWSESDTVYFEVAFRPRDNGSATAANTLLYNIDSSEWDNVDMYTYLTDYTYDKALQVESNGVTLSVMAPAEWFTYETAFASGISWSYTEDLADDSSNRIKFTSADTLEELDKYLDRYEDLTDIDGITVSGNYLNGRHYTYTGYDTIEYYGQIANGKYVSISFVKLPMIDGSPQQIIRDTMTLD